MQEQNPVAKRVDRAHKKFKVSETQLKLFLHSTGGGGEAGAELTQNRDKHTCTTGRAHTRTQKEREGGTVRETGS